MIWRNLWYRRGRSLLTAVGIAIGVAAIIALGAMAEGVAAGYASIAGGSGADLLVTQADVTDLTFSTLDEAIGERIAQLSDVKSVSGVIFNMVQLKDIPYFIVGGYNPDEVAIKHYKMVDGQQRLTDKHILLGRQAADNLKLTVGDTIRLYDVPFRVSGIYETGQSFEEGGGVITLADSQAIFKKPRQVTFFQIQARDPELIDEVQARIEQLFHKVSVSKAEDFADKQSMVQSLKAMAWGISLIAVLIGGLGVINTMVMAVFEQTREIGVLRAVGWRRRGILSLILSQSLVLGLLGGVGGCGLGLLLVWLINRTPSISSFAPGVLRVELLIQGVAVALILGLLGGLYPAWRAAGLSPIEALRYDSGAGDARSPAWSRMLGVSFRNLLRRRTRTLLTIGGIAIGVGLIVSLGAITDGMIGDVTALAGQGGGELFAMQANVASMDYSVIDESVGRAIAALPQVQDVSGLIYGVSTGEDVPFLLVFGIDPNSRALRHFRVTVGHRIRRRGEVMLGKNAADALKKGVGDVIRLPGGVFRVVGLYETGLAYEDGGVVVALTDAQTAFQKPRRVGMYQIKVRDPDQAGEVRDLIEQRFGKDVSVSFTSTFMEDSDDIKNMRAMLGAIYVLAIIVGSVVVTNTMVMAVLERIREIGTLRALGWSRPRVLWMILTEAIMLSIVAAGAGILTGIGLTFAIQSIPGIGLMLSATYTPQVLVQAVGTSLFLGVVGGLYPAWHASRLSPVEALRYE